MRRIRIDQRRLEESLLRSGFHGRRRLGEKAAKPRRAST
jgi:hypothetical protein